MNFETFKKIIISWLNSKETNQSYEFDLLVLELAEEFYGIPSADQYFLITTLVSCANERQRDIFQNNADSFEYKENNVYLNNTSSWHELAVEMKNISEELFLKHSNWNEA